MAAACCGLALQPASADVAWDGGAGTNNWLDVLNWDSDAAPSDATTIGTGAAVIIDDNASTIGNLLLSNNSSLEVKTGGVIKMQDPTVNAGSVLTISGGTVTYRRLGNIAGTLVMTAGSLNSQTNANASQLTEADISGGTWNLNLSPTNSIQFGANGSSNVTLSGSGVINSMGIIIAGDTVARLGNFTITGGTLSALAFQQQRGTIDLSGGSFSTTGDFVWTDTRVTSNPDSINRIFQITGGTGTVNIGGDFKPSVDGISGQRRFVLTAQNSGVTQENISTMHVTGTDSAGGEVKASLQGGILLANAAQYTLISAGTLSATPTYTGSALYNGAADGNDYKITLNTALKQGDLTLSGDHSPQSAAFSLAMAGYVDLDLESLADPKLLVRLDADAGTGSLDDLTTFLAQSGYSGVMLDSFGDYDISFTIDSAYFSGDTMYFGWDFTDFASGAGLMGIQVSGVPEPSALWLLSAAGFSVLLWRRRGGSIRAIS